MLLCSANNFVNNDAKKDLPVIAPTGFAFPDQV